MKCSIVYRNLGDKLTSHPDFNGSVRVQNEDAPPAKKSKQVCQGHFILCLCQTACCISFVDFLFL